jgi:hypothetical protein
LRGALLLEVPCATPWRAASSSNADPVKLGGLVVEELVDVLTATPV